MKDFPDPELPHNITEREILTLKLWLKLEIELKKRFRCILSLINHGARHYYNYSRLSVKLLCVVVIELAKKLEISYLEARYYKMRLIWNNI